MLPYHRPWQWLAWDLLLTYDSDNRHIKGSTVLACQALHLVQKLGVISAVTQTGIAAE